jgi:hypothetical protein
VIRAFNCCEGCQEKANAPRLKSITRRAREGRVPDGDICNEAAGLLYAGNVGHPVDYRASRLVQESGAFKIPANPESSLLF